MYRRANKPGYVSIPAAALQGLVLVPVEKKTIVDAGTEYLREELQLIRRVRQGTLDAARRHLNRFVPKGPESGMVHDITTRHARDFIASISALGHEASSLKVHLGTLSAFWKWCAAQGYTSKLLNPFEGIRTPALPEAVVDVLRIIPAHEVDALFTAPKHRRQRAMTLTMWATALRVSECLRIHRVDVDVAHMRLHVRNRIRGGVDERTKARRGRDVPISSVETLESILFVAEMAAQGALPRRDAYAHDIRHECDWIGISQIWAHSLRHSRISQWVADGVDLELVRRWAGHASLEMTQRYAGARRFRERPCPPDGLAQARAGRAPNQSNGVQPGLQRSEENQR